MHVIKMFKSYMHDILINVSDRTLYVLQCIILMQGMLIGKNVEYLPAKRNISSCSIFSLRFMYDLCYFVSMYMLNLNVDRQ